MTVFEYGLFDRTYFNEAEASLPRNTIILLPTPTPATKLQ